MKGMVEQEQIELVDEYNRPLLKQQLSLLSNNQQQFGGMGADDDILNDSVDIRLPSPDARKLDNAELQIKPQHYSDIQDQVVQFVRQNSLIKDAKNL